MANQNAAPGRDSLVLELGSQQGIQAIGQRWLPCGGLQTIPCIHPSSQIARLCIFPACLNG